MNEQETLRELSWQYLQISKDERNKATEKLHYAINDLEMIRPVVMIEELPWNEFNGYEELKLVCQTPFLRDIETHLRRSIFRNKYMKADTIFQPYLPVRKIINFSGIGLEVSEDIVVTDKANHIVSHDYHDQLKDESDLELLRNVKVTYDEKETMSRFNMLGEIVGDIIPVKLFGVDHVTVVTWDDIARYRGVSNLLIDLAERPEFMHKIVRKLTDISLNIIEQYEELDLFEKSPTTLHCTPVLTKDLPTKNYNGTNKLTRKDVWGRGTAQIFASVSKSMHEEFDIEYMKETIGQCGLSYYGCCEPLDKKIDIVEKLPNLRKISITPWADVNIAAEAINKKYVLSSKPNPASVAVPFLDKTALKEEIKNILDACKKNNCSTELILKDISTSHNNPNNIIEWEKIVMDMVNNY